MMNQSGVAVLALGLIMYVCILVPSAAQQPGGAHSEGEMEWAIGGVGGAYFLAEPGELVVEVVKRDRNIRGARTDLRAILVGPDREVLQEAVIPHDGGEKGSGLGPPQRARLVAQVERKGVYALNITVSRDRYGNEISWGFRTNCPRYLIETARGHRDERHEEPIVLLNPDRPGDVCFMPRTGSFGMEVTGLHPEVREAPVYDARGALVHTLQAGEDNRASHTFPADAHRDATPWRLHLQRAQAQISIDGVTRWDGGDLYRDMAIWTPDPASWFPLLEHRWLLSPYRRLVYGSAGEGGEIAFQVHNNSAREKTVALSLEFPAGEWPVSVSADRVVVGARATAEVLLSYTVPAEGQERACHLRATPADDPDFSTYSTLTVRAGEVPAGQPLTMPVMLRPYAHENEQFGYLPDYPLNNQVYFDLENRPFVCTARGIATQHAGEWVTSELATAVVERVPPLEDEPVRLVSPKIAFDRDNDVYLLGRVGSRAALLHSSDGGRAFRAYAIEGREQERSAFDIEVFTGHNVPDAPPAILRYTRTEARSEGRLRWRSVNDAELILPQKQDGRLTLAEPILLSRSGLGISMHSGSPTCMVSRGTRVHVVWGEATDPAETVPGVPTYVATYDRETGRLGEPVLVGYGAPPNDGHNTPSITMDSEGYLHVLAGTHGRPFQYARSLRPNDAHSGWTDAEPVGEGLSQTYIGMVCGPDDMLHIVFRWWRSGVEPFPASNFGTLAHLRKRPGQAWEEPSLLVVAPFSEYSIFYHRLTIDRLGQLFVSYDYWSTFWFYRNDRRTRPRTVLMSPDGGEQWRLW